MEAAVVKDMATLKYFTNGFVFLNEFVEAYYTVFISLKLWYFFCKLILLVSMNVKEIFYILFCGCNLSHDLVLTPFLRYKFLQFLVLTNKPAQHATDQGKSQEKSKDPC